MKQTLLIIALLLGLENISAQSDASLQETISWLNMYALEDELYKSDYGDGDWKEEKSGLTVSKKENDKLKFNVIEKYRTNKHDWVTSKQHLFDLQDIILIRSGFDEPKYADQDYAYILFMYSTDNQHKELVRFDFRNKENATSLYNALKHLASFYQTNIEFQNNIKLKNKF